MFERIETIISTALASERESGVASDWTPGRTTIAILTAMREPTESMVEAANVADRGMMPWSGQWRAMIDAALSEGAEQSVCLRLASRPGGNATGSKP
ncbi:hypothetical protein J2X47_001982 [Sphingomonas sp. BE270]|jgi:hypothetical protein|uniref:hypothetical protein n=1 Tax=Sphingomonas sp. BE270 TaxID=2817726 RepID=UPI00286387E4|nr:hypothetical protein [Sphingomonas sp. BE270]MDR7257802.1 hypothetical protein [Sphingomonas sp. BE270]